MDDTGFLRFRDAKLERGKRTEEYPEKTSEILEQSSHEQDALTENETERDPAAVLPGKITVSHFQH